MTDSFSNLKDILGNVQFQNISPLYCKIIEDWNQIVGKKFADKSKIDNFITKDSKLIMYVHVFSSPLLQELTFLKKTIINKIKKLYGLTIDDIIIKIANKQSVNFYDNKQTVIRETFDAKPTKEELELVSLEQDVVDRINASVDKQPALSDEEKNRMKEIIFNDLKTQEWMKQKGCPVCKICGAVITEKNFADENICKFCKRK